MMPALFLGHGSPMNALSKNGWTQTLNKLGEILPRPKAVLAISAHWETLEPEIVTAEQPKTIHDFYGFPEELYKIQYSAPGAKDIAQDIIKRFGVQGNSDWGLDHGTWSVLIHMYPRADVPVLQLSLARNFSLQQHFAFGEKLRSLRDDGIMILGSGNIVHNLKQLDWSHEAAKPHEWALEFDQKIKQALLKKDQDVLLSQKGVTPEEWKLSVPSLEHYLPLLYVAGAAKPDEQARFPFEGFSMASLSMRCVVY